MTSQCFNETNGKGSLYKMFKYTVCFVKKNNEILMLNREKAPIMGVWNGVGAKSRKVKPLI